MTSLMVAMCLPPTTLLSLTLSLLIMVNRGYSFQDLYDCINCPPATIVKTLKPISFDV